MWPYLDQDAFEVLINRHAAEFHAKIANLEPGSLRLHLLHLVRVHARYFVHQQIEQAIGYQWDHLVARLQDRERGCRLLRVVENVKSPLNTCGPDLWVSRRKRRGGIVIQSYEKLVSMHFSQLELELNLETSLRPTSIQMCVAHVRAKTVEGSS